MNTDADLHPVHKSDIWFLPCSISKRVDVSLILSLDETCYRDKQLRFPYSYCCKMVKFMFSKKSTKIDKIFTVDTTFCQIDGEDFVNFCGLLRKREL